MTRPNLHTKSRLAYGRRIPQLPPPQSAVVRASRPASLSPSSARGPATPTGDSCASSLDPPNLRIRELPPRRRVQAAPERTEGMGVLVRSWKWGVEAIGAWGLCAPAMAEQMRRLSLFALIGRTKINRLIVSSLNYWNIYKQRATAPPYTRG